MKKISWVLIPGYVCAVLTVLALVSLTQASRQENMVASSQQFEQTRLPQK